MGKVFAGQAKVSHFLQFQSKPQKLPLKFTVYYIAISHVCLSFIAKLAPQMVFNRETFTQQNFSRLW